MIAKIEAIVRVVWRWRRGRWRWGRGLLVLVAVALPLAPVFLGFGLLDVPAEECRKPQGGQPAQRQPPRRGRTKGVCESIELIRVHRIPPHVIVVDTAEIASVV